MATPAELTRLTALASRFGAFVAEQYPFALADAIAAFESAGRGRDPRSEQEIDALRPAVKRELEKLLNARPTPGGLADTTPRTSAKQRIALARTQLVQACDGFLRRAAIEASLTPDERIEILRGMLLTRATDNRLKTLFTSGEIKYEGVPFQGKGFRSLGQEAIYAA